MIKFSNQDRFIITGATSGIGKSCALLLNSLGAQVIAIGRNADKLAEVKNTAASPELFNFELKDLSKEIELQDKWIIQISQKYGNIRGLVLSAGIRHTTPIKAISYSKLKELFDVNLFSNIMIAKGFGHSKANAGSGSSIVMISSISAITGGKGIISYSSSKAALLTAIKSMALEFSSIGIRVNAILPGYVETEMLKNDDKLFNKNLINEIDNNYPLGIGKPKDIAQLVCFLLSDCASWITGSDIIIDGGATLV